MNPLATLSDCTGPRTACRERVCMRNGRDSLVTAASLDSELADWAAGAPLIRLAAWRNSAADGRVR